MVINKEPEKAEDAKPGTPGHVVSYSTRKASEAKPRREQMLESACTMSVINKGTPNLFPVHFHFISRSAKSKVDACLHGKWANHNKSFLR